MARVSLRVNGKRRSVDVDDPETPLLYVLRDDLGLHGPKFGCGVGQCGSCAVLVDGRGVRSCTVPVRSAAGRRVTTLEGLGSAKRPHPIQAAFVEEQAAQCGYCVNGMIMTAGAFLDRNPRPTEAQVKEALAGNLCRCGTHVRILRAVMRAAAALPGGRS